MMDYDISKQIESCRSWFKDHEALFQNIKINDKDILILNWKKPNSNIYSIQYIIYKNCLYVTGDVSSAVYSFTGNQEWESIASCSLDYFAKKCVASDNGIHNSQWYNEKCMKTFYEYVDSLCENINEEYHKLNEEEKNNIRQKLLEDYDGGFDAFEEEALSSSVHPDYWGHFMQENYMFFGDSCYEKDWGLDVSVTCISHWLGIIMAISKNNKNQFEKICQESLNNSYISVKYDEYNKMKNTQEHMNKGILKRILYAIKGK